MKPILKRTIVVLLLCVLTGAAVYKTCWLRSWKAAVQCESQPNQNARVYLRSGGDVVVMLAEPYQGTYVLKPRENSVGLVFGGFTVNSPVLLAGLRETYSMIDAHDPKLRVSQRSAEFLNYEGRAVRLNW